MGEGVQELQNTDQVSRTFNSFSFASSRFPTGDGES
jgi:hypothetical protein